MAIYLLRRHFGISAREWWTTLPRWEADLLLTGLEREAGGDTARPLSHAQTPAKPSGLRGFMAMFGGRG